MLRFNDISVGCKAPSLPSCTLSRLLTVCCVISTRRPGVKNLLAHNQAIPLPRLPLEPLRRRRLGTLSEAATTHIECFELFTRTYTRLNAPEGLWRAAARRKPWRGAAAVVLCGEVGTSSEAVAVVAERYGFSQTTRLAAQIIRMVWGYSENDLFWRLVSALGMTMYFEAVPMGDFTFIPLHCVAPWERGSLPTRPEDLCNLPVVRLTFNSRGIRELERLPAGEPQYSSRRFDDMAFTITDESCFEGVTVLGSLLVLQPPDTTDGSKLTTGRTAKHASSA